jgi:hypothetical protein
MAAIDDLVTRIREAMKVDASYETTIIPYGVKRAGVRLLRDYHFPWSVNKEEYTPIAAGQQNYALPSGFKKELGLYFYDRVDLTYSEPLLKREGFVLPGLDGVPRHYWLWNGNLSTDIKIPDADANNLDLVLWYESISWEDNMDWMLERFEDVLFTLATFRLATEHQKKELSEIFGILWADDRTALAKYANELEFDNAVFVQREARGPDPARYPR